MAECLLIHGEHARSHAYARHDLTATMDMQDLLAACITSMGNWPWQWPREGAKEINQGPSEES